MIEYCIVRANESYTLTEAVRENIERGWIPQGGVAYSGAGGKCSIPGGWAQAMIRETK